MGLPDEDRDRLEFGRSTCQRTAMESTDPRWVTGPKILASTFKTDPEISYCVVGPRRSDLDPRAAELTLPTEFSEVKFSFCARAYIGRSETWTDTEE